MIPQTFEYTAPKTLDEALALMADGAKPLTGGMSLIPMMKLRLAAPDHLVDLGRLKDLNYIREEGGALHIGATTTHQEVTTRRWCARSVLCYRRRRAEWRSAGSQSRNDWRERRSCGSLG